MAADVNVIDVRPGQAGLIGRASLRDDITGSVRACVRRSQAYAVVGETAWRIS